MAILDILKGGLGGLKTAASFVANPVGTAFAQANKLTQKPAQPAQASPAPQTNVSQAAAPLGPSGPSSAVPSVPSIPSLGYEDQVRNEMYNLGTTNTLPVPTVDTIRPSELSPSNNRSSLLRARQALEDKFMRGLTQDSGAVSQLADLRLKIAKQKEKDERELEELRKNKGGLYQGALADEERKLMDEQERRLGYLASQESALVSSLQFEQDAQESVVKNLQTIKDLTGQDPIGGIQFDEATGQYLGFFQTPEGTIESQVLYEGTPKQNFDTVGGVQTDPYTGEQYIYQQTPEGFQKVSLSGGIGGGLGGSTTAQNPELLGWAQQYAQSGTKPTGLPAGAFGIISQMAKDLPKSNGLVVDKNTNVKSSGVSAAIETDIADFYNIAQNLKKLKELEKEVSTGVLPGLFGSNVLGQTEMGKKQTEFIKLRDEIIDQLSRNRTGAALTGHEEEFYRKQLPGKFSEPLGVFGQDRGTLIQTFEDKILGSLNNYLAQNNLAIYGMTKVQTPYGEFTAGDIIQGPMGTGRVNPDGSISPVGQSFSPAGNASASNLGNVPQRNNNPGNVKQGGLADDLATGVDSQGHLIFPNAQAGLMALQRDIQAKVSGNSRHLPANPTIAQLGRVYAEDPNWGNAVARILGVSPNTATGTIPIAKLTEAIARQEGWFA